MRESNSRSVQDNRAVQSISQTEYDRTALDCTSALPLLNSLLHLGYQVTVSPTIRLTLTNDGGLERIVHILVNCRKTDELSIKKRYAAFNCIYNICTRGTEMVRYRLVQAGLAEITLAMLWKSLMLIYQANQGDLEGVKKLQMEKQMKRMMPQIKHQHERQEFQLRNQLLQEQVQQQRILIQMMSLPPVQFEQLQLHSTEAQPEHHLLEQYNQHQARIDQLREQFEWLMQLREQSINVQAVQYQQQRHLQLQIQARFRHNQAHRDILQQPSFNFASSRNPFCRLPIIVTPDFKQNQNQQQPKRRTTFLKRHPRKSKTKSAFTTTGVMNTFLKNILDDRLFGQEQHIVFALRLLAFLTKHSLVREILHPNYKDSIFTVVEKFTHFDYTQEINTWARAVMLHFCKRDDAKGGLRRCANLECNNWESYPREFAKCHNCRRIRYCSVTCQLNAWLGGHEFWCCKNSFEFDEISIKN
ncbi:MAG: hypothetical protein EXX96DRAFT_551302 [Benjaminiella poitrasii]|nr:MAG: hypothetical protein EXX96DRAFT_551302 [Benjaminiella poitrasii]